ncbi:CotH kinase family protein [Marinifilum flexuosum]|uniref:CotH kinase family protein n=1 Tax=Marinifilum flexuosum TaxID=1117708 RepID=UPI0024947E68|nr:CotH kinase family protein [Marinifilum flexuosum]
MRFFLFLILSFCFTWEVCAQNATNSPYETLPLFSSDEIFEIKLKGDIRKLFNDRKENATYHPFIFSYDINNQQHSLDIRVKTRGHFRKMRANCATPPLLLNFDTLPDLAKTIFKGQNKLKLVTTCDIEKFVVQEYLVYKIYQLITEKSFQVRLVKVIFEDTKRNKTRSAKYGILLEDQNKMAKRNHSAIRKQLNVNPQTIDKESFLKMAVFQYLIGNTDWSIQYLHNIKLLVNHSGKSIVTVPYDFDMSGIVNTPYAAPAEALQLSSVRNRRYRGYCLDNMNEFESTFELFNDLKKEIYAIYQNNTLIDKTYKKNTIRYLDKFYEIINNKELSKREFQYPCDPNGTGNIIIRGLKKYKENSKKNSDK